MRPLLAAVAKKIQSICKHSKEHVFDLSFVLMNMTCSFTFIYVKTKNTMRNKAPPLVAISKDMVVRRCNTDLISQFQGSMSRVTPEASRHLQWAATCSVFPQQLPGSHAKTYFIGRSDGHGNVPVPYCEHHPIEEWRCRALLEVPGCRHWVSICLDRNNLTRKGVFSSSTCQKERVRGV